MITLLVITVIGLVSLTLVCEMLFYREEQQT